MNGYRRGAYENMTKDMNNEERILTLCITLRVLIGSHKTSVFALDIMHLRYQYQNIVSSKDSFGITKGVQSVSMHAGSTLAITDPNKAKGIIYMPEHLTHSQKWSHAVDQDIYNGVASTKDLM